MMGRRLSKVVDGVGTYFVYDRDDVLLDFVDDGGGVELDIRYLHGDRVDEVLAQDDTDSNVTWLLTDHLGSIRDLVDNSGTVVNHLTYDSYGNVVSETDASVDSRYRFTGREWDEEIELHYYRARYYDGQTGRFISVDPIGFESETYNLYGYVDNNPINTKDPFGLYGLILSQQRLISYDDDGLKATNNIGDVINAYRDNPRVIIKSDVTVAHIWFSPSNTGTGTTTSVTPPGMTRKDVRGHIVGAQLGGSGKDLNNLFAQNSKDNNSAWKGFENSARKYLDIKGFDPNCFIDLIYAVKLNYQKNPFLRTRRRRGDQLRPTSYDGAARFSDGKLFRKSLSNDFK